SGSCEILGYITAIVDFIHRTSLASFLLWRLKKINQVDENRMLDNVISIMLLLTRTLFQFSQVLFLQPRTTLNSGKEFQVTCNSAFYENRIAVLGFINTDFVIEIFVAFRFFQILLKGKYLHRDNSFNSFILNNSDKVINAVLFWFIIWVILAAFLDIVSILDTLNVVEPNKFISRTLNLVVCVAMSCVITLDREIIKAYSRCENSI
ncbi:25159_t:CDS:2, partial [Dentiscutata erythropus]